MLLASFTKAASSSGVSLGSSQGWQEAAEASTIGKTAKKTFLRAAPAHANLLVPHDGSMETHGQAGFIACENVRVQVLTRLKPRTKAVHRLDE